MVKTGDSTTNTLQNPGTRIREGDGAEYYLFLEEYMKIQLKNRLQSTLQSKLANSEGFTLLEILVVLTIMGFLIAMVAPRLAGISGDAVDTVCDTNQNRMITYMASYYEKTSRFPSNLTNLVEETADATYQIPAVSDDNPENGAETLSSEFYGRNHFHIHYLSEDEADELKGMGIVQVLNLNSYDVYDDDGTLDTDYDNDINDVAVADTVTKAPSMEETEVADGLGVAMVGMGMASGGTSFTVSSATERGWGEPDWFGRIVLGIGPESGLITDGIIGNAAHCPGGIQNEDNVTYNDYNLVLPRLEATADLMEEDTSITAMDADSDTDGTQIQAVSYDDGEEPDTDYNYTTNTDNYKVREFTIDEAEEGWQYATQCPEGHMYPEDDGEYWAIDLDASGTIAD